MQNSTGASNSGRPSIEDVKASPELFYETDLKQYALTDGLRLLVLHATNSLLKNTQAKAKEALESHAQKRWLVDLKSRINKLTNRDEGVATGELNLQLKKADNNLFLQEDHLRCALRLTKLVQQHTTPDGSLDFSDAAIDASTGTLLTGYSAENNPRLEAKLELHRLLVEATEKNYTIPAHLKEGAAKLEAEETQALLTHLKTRSGIDSDTTQKKLEDTIELRKLLREAEAQGLVTFKERYNRDETTDLHSLIDRKIGIISTDIDQHNVRLQQYNQDRGNWMAVLNNICKTVGEMGRSVARNIAR